MSRTSRGKKKIFTFFFCFRESHKLLAFLYSISLHFLILQTRVGDTHIRIKYHSSPGAVIKRSSKERKLNETR